MDFFTQLVFFGFFLGALYLLKRRQFLFTMLPVVFLGGFFYQLISEGKAQYIIPYFIVMTAFAAFGLVSFYDTVAAKVKPDSMIGRICAVKYPAAAVAEVQPASGDTSAEPEQPAEPEQTEEAAETESAQETAAEASKASAAQNPAKKKQSRHKKGAKK